MTKNRITQNALRNTQSTLCLLLEKTGNNQLVSTGLPFAIFFEVEEVQTFSE